MAQAARAIEYADDLIRYAAAGAEPAYAIPDFRPQEAPSPYVRAIPRAKPNVQARGISLFAVFGGLLAAVLMVFVVLAQVSYNEVTVETSRLNSQLERLTEQERRLEIAFDSVINMKEVERYARDVLGMSKPDANQVVVFQGISQDKAEIVAHGNEGGALRDFGAFISSLFDYFRR